MEISQYTQTLTATDISNGYVTITTTVSRESIIGVTGGTFDVTNNFFYGGNWDQPVTGYLTNLYGATNYIRIHLGDQAAASDVVKVVIFHLAA